MITKRKDHRGGAGRGGGRPKGPTGKAGITVTLRVTPKAREALRLDDRPGELVSLLVERYLDAREARPSASAPARPADDGQDAGPVVDPHDA